MQSTVRLYFDDPWLFEFEARVVARSSHEGRPSVVLDRTAFYPEGGGQMADHGTLGPARVVDVQLDEAGTLHHVLEAELSPDVETVQGRIDRERRRVHMALHTGQHVLSRALVDVARAETVSSRLGETACTIDVDVAALAEALIARAVDLSNSIVDDDVPVRAFFPEPDELARLPLRRAPKVEDSVRVVTVGEFDVTPCGGTHVTSSAQIGFVHVTGVERYKGGTRLTFASGRRAREQLAAESGLLRALSRDFSCGPNEVSAAVDKLRRELGTSREKLGQLRAEVAERAADALLERAGQTGDPVMVAAFDDATVEILRAIGARLSALPEAVALLAGRSDDGTQVLCVRGSGSSFDCGAFVKRIAGATGGRGGGRPERAEGRLPPGVDWDALCRAELSR
jgi:alanyl-tRNA synthetase